MPLPWIRRIRTRHLAAAATLAVLAIPFVHQRLAGGNDDRPPYTHFEIEPVRPIALSADGRHLYVLNNADDYLEIYAATPSGLVRVGETPVGLRPVAIALTETTAWVTNHLSDSVSVVDISDPSAPRVTHTLPVGDEPRDIVIAGPAHDRVFVATARRDNLTTPGEPRGAVWMFHANSPDTAPVTIALQGMKPRALAASSDGATVYAAVFKSGNGTTVVSEPDVTAGGGAPPAVPTPKDDPPNTSLIVLQQGNRWVDESFKDWSDAVGYSLPDSDVFTVDASSDVPRVTNTTSGVGTVLFNMAVHPSGDLWVTNTDAQNFVRFEPNLTGGAAPSRITIIDRETELPMDVPLNPHIDHTRPGTPAERALSLTQPLQVVFNASGDRAYVAAFLSRKVAELDAEGTVLRRFGVGFGPAGVALNEEAGRLFVLNSLDNTVSTVDLVTGLVSTRLLHHDPLPPEVTAGRPFLFDAEIGSSNGEMSCATCHVFADNDGLAWDLGDPAGDILPIPFNLTHPNIVLKPRSFEFHPMKGPMTTQSFRGMAGAGPMHWRGDRFSNTDPDDEIADFRKFNPAFVSLNGRASELTTEEMDSFGRYLLTIHYPPNPVQNLDRSLTREQQAGFDIFTGDELVDSRVTNCAGCHTLPLGTNGRVNFEGDRFTQDFKAPHLRALYEKVGRFDGSSSQPTGFGFINDGSVDTLFTFLHEDVFEFGGRTETENNRMRSDLEQFLLAFDTGMAPLVGRGPTVSGPANAEETGALELLMTRATAGDCDLVAHASVLGNLRGWTNQGSQFIPDKESAAPAQLADLLALAEDESSPVSFVCVPPGSGVRSGIDRDLDGYLNGDELDAGSDPGDAGSWPGSSTVTPTPTSTVTATPQTVVFRGYLPDLRHP